MAKIFATLGYAVDPEVEARIGIETSCALADGIAARAGRLARRHRRPAGEGEECDVVIVGSGAGGAAAAATLAEAGLDVIVLEAGGHYNRDNYPSDPLEAIASLYRDAGLTDRRGPPADPGAGREGGRRHDGDQLRAPASAPPSRCSSDWRERPRGRAGRATSTPTSPRPRSSCASPSSTPSGWAATASWRWRAPRRSAPAAARSPATPATACSAAPAPSAARSTPSAACTSATCRARSPPGRGSAPGSRRSRVLVEDGRAVGVELLAGARRRTARAAPTRSAPGGRRSSPAARSARRSCCCAPGLGGDQVGRNLHIHPACWVGARYEEEVRGWDGVMQSYYVDEWEPQRVLLEATFTPLAFGGAWLLGAGREHQEAMLDFGHVGSIGVHLSDRSAGRVGLAGDGSLRATYRLTDDDARRLAFGIARAAEVHFAAGATEVYPNIARVRRSCGPATWPSSRRPRFKPSELRLEAFHPMGTARIVADPRRGRLRRRRLGPRRRRPLRRRRLALPDLGRRQPDDDHHRLRQAGRPRDRRVGGLAASGSAALSARAPATRRACAAACGGGRRRRDCCWACGGTPGRCGGGGGGGGCAGCSAPEAPAAAAGGRRRLGGGGCGAAGRQGCPPPPERRRRLAREPVGRVAEGRPFLRIAL